MNIKTWPNYDVQITRLRSRLFSNVPLAGHIITLFVLLAISLLAMKEEGAVGFIGISLIIFIVALILGCALGFLFGIPRVANRDDVRAKNVVGQIKDIRRFLDTNTNLEKVSDWLTTMLVGVGLTQIGNIDGALRRFREFLSTNIILYPNACNAGGCTDAAGNLPAVGPFLLLGGVSLGFLYFYIVTRVILTPKLVDVEKGMGLPEAVENEVRNAAKTMTSSSAAAHNVAAATHLSVDDALAVMFEKLYEPEGYNQVLALGESLARTDAIRRPEYWFYLAAAYGQQYNSLDINDDVARSHTREKLFNAARQAAALNPSFKGRLWAISDPNGYDNDLADFRDDQGFLAIVGRPQRGKPNQRK